MLLRRRYNNIERGEKKMVLLLHHHHVFDILFFVVHSSYFRYLRVPLYPARCTTRDSCFRRVLSYEYILWIWSTHNIALLSPNETSARMPANR